jgi:hypothetical protein
MLITAGHHGARRRRTTPGGSTAGIVAPITATLPLDWANLVAESLQALFTA